MKKQYLILTIISSLLFTGCDKKKDFVFEENSTARLNASIDNVYNVLKAKQNWILSYYPGVNQEYGGFNLFPNFTTNTDVSLQGDFTTSIAASTFKIYPGAGPILTFDTYNFVIHYFALPAAYTSTTGGIGAVDSGMRGDYEFLVLSANQDSIILKGRKNGNVMKLLPVSADQQSAAIVNYRTANIRFNTYRGFTVEVNNKVFQAIPTVSTVNGTIRPNRSFTVTTTGVTVSFIVTDTGIEFYKEYTIEGVKMNKLSYVAATAQYPQGYYTNANSTIKLIPRLTTAP